MSSAADFTVAKKKPPRSLRETVASPIGMSPQNFIDSHHHKTESQPGLSKGVSGRATCGFETISAAAKQHGVEQDSLTSGEGVGSRWIQKY